MAYFDLFFKYYRNVYDCQTCLLEVQTGISMFWTFLLAVTHYIALALRQPLRFKTLPLVSVARSNIQCFVKRLERPIQHPKYVPIRLVGGLNLL